MRPWCALALFSFAVWYTLFFPRLRRPVPVVKESFAWIQN
ncbi:hypothetical protein LCGC14_0587950 [marine sediment metagenome]|uniref:Uncharacterized protein n=1 Tax=marine sediment metagenome TaxID=412755 RepID=A0A0F9RYA9_9ZZZZ